MRQLFEAKFSQLPPSSSLSAHCFTSSHLSNLELKYSTVSLVTERNDCEFLFIYLIDAFNDKDPSTKKLSAVIVRLKVQSYCTCEIQNY